MANKNKRNHKSLDRSVVSLIYIFIKPASIIPLQERPVFQPVLRQERQHLFSVR